MSEAVNIFLKSKRIFGRGIDWLSRKIKQPFVTVYWIPYYLYKKVTCHDDAVFCECFLRFHGYRVKKNNWGDDINAFFFQTVSDKQFVFMPFDRTLLKVKRYLLIGSIIGYGNLKNTMIYGSGIKNPKIRLIGKPKKVYSVRGPRTRDILLAHQIDCPENYGDPALLLPLFYHPTVPKKYKYGFVANEATDTQSVINCVEKLNIAQGEYLIIDMTNYKNWTDIIDEILSCENIISESLHGLIVAESYKIPNCWVEFIGHKDFWPFKYLDFYESIEKYGCESVKIYQNDEQMDKRVAQCLQNWKPATIDYQQLLSYCPLNLMKNRLCCDSST